MCYNVEYIKRRAAELAERYKRFVKSEPDLWRPPGYQENMKGYFISGFSYPVLPFVTDDAIDYKQWGLIPSWVKDRQKAEELRRITLNAVGETVFEKPAYRTAIKTRRGILPVNGFYEWREFNKVKYPYLVSVKNEELFSLGCLYENWVDKSTGEILNTFSIITTPANPLMEQIHNLKKRMPLILKKEDEDRWCDPSLTKEQIQELIKPLDQDLLDAYTVSRDVNSARNNRDVEESVKMVEYPELPPLVK